MKHVAEILFTLTMVVVFWGLLVIFAFGCTTANKCKKNCYQSIDNIEICQEICK